ncbi:MAG TPA: SDR family oxidoreductase [Opitutaceae bacterium]|nr:SDR family oxidoreductase [Opitutaceae bacterium]
MNIVITGSSTGIGRAITEFLLERGDRVWGLARSDQAGLAQVYSNFSYSRVDVASWEQVSGVAEKILGAMPHIDALIACAGIQGAVGPAMTLDPQKWSETVRVNLDGTFFPIRALYSGLQHASGRGKIVCFSGGGATKPRLNFSAYGVAKTGVVRLVETLGGEMREDEIDINAVAPGAINTRLTDEVLQLGPEVSGEAEYQAALKQKASGGGSIEKAVGLVAFLISSESDGITGRLISAPWDPWPTLGKHQATLAHSDVYTLRRIVPEERNLVLGDQP